MRRLISVALLSAAVALGAVSVAQAQDVERSGNVFHKRACPGPEAPRNVRCHAHVVTDASGNIITNTVPKGYGPSDLQNAYNLNTSTGAGVWIAIVDAYGYPNAESNLGVYRAQYGLSPCTTSGGCFKKVNQTGGTSYPKSNTGWDQEQALDLDMVSAACPKCKILLVEANSSSLSDIAKAENYAAGFGAHAISNSYGAGESGTTSYASAYYHPGIAITVSSGDSGYSAGPQFPASTTYVTAVGGTSLYHSPSTVNGVTRNWTESVWSGAGSGCSTVYAKPSWQLDSPPKGLCAMRTVADVSAVADPNTGVAVYGPVFGNFSGWMVFGGTSVAAPLVAAIYGLNGSSVIGPGQNPYTGLTSYPYATSPFLNVIYNGWNGSCTGSNYLCTASPQWNYNGPAGLGTPNSATNF